MLYGVSDMTTRATFRDQFGHTLRPGDIITYPYKRYGGHSYYTNVAKVMGVSFDNEGHSYLKTKIIKKYKLGETTNGHRVRRLVQEEEREFGYGRLRVTFTASKIPPEYLYGTEWEMLLR